MRYLFLFSSLLFSSLFLQAQSQTELNAEQWTDFEINSFYTGTLDTVENLELDTKPLFLKQAVIESMRDMKYPAIARENGVKGTVKIRVHLDANGHYISAKPVQGIGAGCEEEALFMVQKIIRRGVKPAMKGGTSVPVIFDFPVVFSLQ